MAGPQLYRDLFGATCLPPVASPRGSKPPTAPRRCKQCGKPVQLRTKRRGPQPSYCTVCRPNRHLFWRRCSVSDCAKKARASHNWMCFKHYAQQHKRCAVCNTLMGAAYRHKEKWCPSCRLVEATCQTCGTPFSFYRGLFNNPTFRGIYCSVRCSPRMLPQRTYHCEGCGIEFRPRRGSRRAGRFHSRACYFLSIGAQPAAENELNRALNDYGRKKAAIYEPIDRRRVFERDGWKCQICGRPLDRTRKAPHPRSPTIDHIIPLGVGGSHTYDNVQAAHFRCNSKRQHIGPAQMIMFGRPPADRS